MAHLDPKNNYHRIDQSYVIKEPTYRNFKHANVRLNNRMVVWGPPGRHKSDFIYGLARDVFELQTFDNVIVAAKELDVDPLYLDLRDQCRKAGCHGAFTSSLDTLCNCDGDSEEVKAKKLGKVHAALERAQKQRATAGKKKRKRSDDSDDDEDEKAPSPLEVERQMATGRSAAGGALAVMAPCPNIHLSNLSGDTTTLLIIDDFCSDDQKTLKKLDRWFTGSRRHGVFLVLVCHADTSVPTAWRKTVPYWALKPGINVGDLERFLRGMTTRDNIPAIVRLYKKICDEGEDTDTMLLDFLTKDPLLKARFNFRPTRTGVE